MIGSYAGQSITTGATNIAIGYQAMDSLTQGDHNIAIGFDALGAMAGTDGNDKNIAIGSYALDAAGQSSNVANQNVAIGHHAGTVVTTGDDNVLLTTNTGGSTSEVISDYEEGTWTPAFNASSSNPTVDSGTFTGMYTKVGRQVHLSLFMSAGDISNVGSGSAQIGGLPFTVGATVNPMSSIQHITASQFSAEPKGIYARAGETKLQFIEENGSQPNFTVSNSYTLGITISYHAA